MLLSLKSLTRIKDKKNQDLVCIGCISMDIHITDMWIRQILEIQDKGTCLSVIIVIYP